MPRMSWEYWCFAFFMLFWIGVAIGAGFHISTVLGIVLILGIVTYLERR